MAFNAFRTAGFSGATTDTVVPAAPNDVWEVPPRRANPTSARVQGPPASPQGHPKIIAFSRLLPSIRSGITSHWPSPHQRAGERVCAASAGFKALQSTRGLEGRRRARAGACTPYARTVPVPRGDQ